MRFAYINEIHNLHIAKQLIGILFIHRITGIFVNTKIDYALQYNNIAKKEKFIY